MNIKRRDVLYSLLGFSLPLIASSCASPNSPSQTTSSSNQPAVSPSPASVGKTVRIGYQRASELDILRTRGVLEQQLQPQGAAVEWVFFQAGPPMLEAMNAGSLDFGGVGEAPPVFAQAAGTKFFYVATTPRGPETQDIVVPINSSIQSVAELRGKKIAFQKGSSAHYLLVRVLQDNKISPDEIEIVSLPPADARVAFEQGNVDAWSIWDPFLAVIEASGKARNLNVGRDRVVFMLASQAFAKDHPELLRIVLDGVKQNEIWGQQNTRRIAEQFSQELKIPPDLLNKVNQRRGWGLQPITEAAIAKQQEVADTFYQLKIVPKDVQVKESTLTSTDYAKIYPAL